MDNSKKYLKSTVIVLFILLIRVFVALIAGQDPLTYKYSYNSIVNTYGIAAVASLILLISYGSLAFIFIIFEKSISGSKLVKALKFSSFGFVSFWGFIEVIPLMNTPVFQTIEFGIIDGSIWILFSFILSFFIGSKTPEDSNNSSQYPLLKIIIIATVFTLGRYLSYILGMDSSYTTKIIETFFWTLIMGIWIGYMYILLLKSNVNYSPLKKAILFGIVIFGSFWFIYIMTASGLYNIPWLPTLIRAVLDIFYVILGVVVVENLINMKNHLSKHSN